MDEPLGALDKNLRQAIQVELKRLHAAVGATVVYVTHDQEEPFSSRTRSPSWTRDGSSRSARRASSTTGRPTASVATFLGECNFVPAGEGTLAVRPEKVRVGTAAQGCEHVLAARVASVDFIGRGFRVLLEHRGSEIAALVDATDEIAALQPGAEATFGFRAGDVLDIASH